MFRITVVTNIPAPYRVPVYNRLAKDPGLALHALYAARSEPDRSWDLPTFEHAHTFMEGRHIERAGRYIHHTPDVAVYLRALRPQAVITTGFNPTHLSAWWYAKRNRIPHIVMTDGTEDSEARLSLAHRAVRRVVFANSGAFIVASAGGERLLRRYGVAGDRIHRSPLCANTSVSWTASPAGGRDIDLLFSARLVPIKNAAFALRVAAGTAALLGRTLRMAIMGSGPEEGSLRRQAEALRGQVEVTFTGHVLQAEVPLWFLRSRIFLFPTTWDPWGVVANEACLAGLPVLVSPHAGVAGDLVRDGVNGRVLPLQEADWVRAAADLLSDAASLQRMSLAAIDAVAPYNFETAAQGMADAARQALAGQQAPQA